MLFQSTCSLVLLVAGAAAQVNRNNSLTNDAYWHNRYHALLSMAAYGDYNTTCPNQTFTEDSMLRNFPNSSYPPVRDIISTFGPTPSGAEGFTAIVPEMNKALIVFRGNYTLEQSLPLDFVGFEALNETLAGECKWYGQQNGYGYRNCTMNAFALQGYLEAKNETNNWEDIIDAYQGQGLVFSITGHGLGGMHALIASQDLNHQSIAYYSHSYGAPRTFNDVGALWYNYNFWGESGERGIAQNDNYTEFIPESENYTHAGTPFYYSGYNNTALGMNWDICWNSESTECAPTKYGDSAPIQDHYFYFTPVGQCGSPYRQNLTIINEWLQSENISTDGLSSGINYGSSSSTARHTSSTHRTRTSSNAYDRTTRSATTSTRTSTRRSSATRLASRSSQATTTQDGYGTTSYTDYY